MTDDSAHPMFVALGREMKIARERSKLTQLELADLIHYSDSLISSIENGRRPPTDEFFALCDASLNTGGLLTRLLETARMAAHQEILPSWLRDWREYEREADALRWYEAALIPGLLQTPKYLENLTRTIWPLLGDDEISRKVAERLERCEILYRENPPRLFAILDEAVLRRPVGGPKVMRQQLEHLVKLNEEARALIQVLPLTVGFHHGLVGSFFLASFGGAESDVAYIEGQLRGTVTDSHRDVARIRDIWDMLRADALPMKLSTEMLREVADSWT